MAGESASSTTYSEINKPAYKCKQRYVDCTGDQLTLICCIHGPGNSPDECKILNDFGYKYTKGPSYKKHSQDLVFKGKNWDSKRKNTVIQHVVDEIILKEKEKVGMKDETHENIYDEIDKDNM